MPSTARPLDLGTLRAATVDATGAVVPLCALTTGTLTWPAPHAHRVLHAWSGWARVTPGIVRTAARLVREPGRAPLIAVDVAVAREVALAPLRRLEPVTDDVAAGPAAAIALAPPVSPWLLPVTAGVRLRALPGEAVDALLGAAGPEARAELLTVELARPGGAWAVTATGPGRDPEEAERVGLALERLERALAAWR